MGKPVEIPVALTGEDKDYIVRATLQDDGPAAEPGVLDVLVHGGMYNRGYWDWQGPLAEHQSVVRAAARVGRATLAIDRLGSGESSPVPSTYLTVDAAAHVLHQVIEWAQWHGYRKVNVVGHSLGSMIAAVAAARWPGDVAALVLSGVLHGPLPAPREAEASITRASDDRLFDGRHYDSGYVTISPEKMKPMLYYQADPEIIAWDRAHRDVFSLTEFGTANELWLAPPQSNISARITAPVHVIVGERDAFFTGYPGAPDVREHAGLHEFERAYFPRARSLTVTVIPDMGHCLALHPSGPRVSWLIHDWLASAGADAAGVPAVQPAG